MSIRVELADLPAEIARRGPAAFLVTTGDERPHVVAVSVSVVDGVLDVGAGRRTSANVAQRAEVTLLWPNDAEHPRHSLIVDGTATLDPSPLDPDGDRLRIVATSAIKHRAGGRRRAP